MKRNTVLKVLDFNSKPKQIILAVLLALGLIITSQGNRHTLSVATMVFVYVALCQSWNILSGYTGLFSICHSMFFGIGIYSVIACARAGISIPVSILVSVALNLLMGAIIFGISRKITGVFFFMVMIAMLQILNSVIIVTYEWTGGNNGIALAPSYIVSRQTTYWLLLAIAFVMTFLAYIIRRSKVGTHFVALRENADLAQSLGCNVSAWQFLAVEISVVTAGLIGCAYSFYAMSVNNTIFTGTTSLKIMIVAMVGGMCTTWGPWLGSVIIVFDEFLRGIMPSKLSPVSVIVYAIILILISMYKPDGVISFFGIREKSPAFSKMLRRKRAKVEEGEK